MTSDCEIIEEVFIKKFGCFSGRKVSFSIITNIYFGLTGWGIYCPSYPIIGAGASYNKAKDDAVIPCVVFILFPLTFSLWDKLLPI